MSSIDVCRARIAALEAEFRSLEEPYRQHYAYDFSDWDAEPDEFDEAIRGATALQAQFEQLPDKVNALREDLVVLVQQATHARDMAQTALDAAEQAISDAEDVASDADQLEDGAFERDDLNEAIATLETRRREVIDGRGEKGVPRHMLKRKDVNDRRERKTDTMRGNLQQQLAALEQLLAVGRDAQETLSQAIAEEDGRDDDPEGEGGSDASDEFRQQFQRQLAEIERQVAQVRQKAAGRLEQKDLMSILSLLSSIVSGIGISMAVYEFATGTNPFDALYNLRRRVENAIEDWRGNGEDDKIQQAERALELIDQAEDAAEREQADGDKAAKKPAAKTVEPRGYAHKLYA